MSKLEMGIRIERLREYHKLTREELAEKAGISAKFLYEVERGKKGISAETLWKIAQALSCSCDYLLKGDSAVTVIGKRQSDSHTSLSNMFDQKQLKKVVKIIQLIRELCND